MQGAGNRSYLGPVNDTSEAPPPVETHVTVERGAVTVIRLDRPRKKNAITAAMYTALADALDEATRDDAVRVVLIGSSGGVFTAGNDLMDFLQNPPSGPDSPVFRLLEALCAFPKPLVAAVDGPAIGLGTTLLLHCDLVYASDRARFQMPFVNLGLTPEGGSSYFLPRRVGNAKASEWLMFGEPFSAAEAKEAGLVNAVVPAGELDAFALEKCGKLALKAPGALRACKELMRGPERPVVREAMLREGAEFVERLGSPDAIEALTRFLAPKG